MYQKSHSLLCIILIKHSPVKQCISFWISQLNICFFDCLANRRKIIRFDYGKFWRIDRRRWDMFRAHFFWLLNWGLQHFAVTWLTRLLANEHVLLCVINLYNSVMAVAECVIPFYIFDFKKPIFREKLEHLSRIKSNPTAVLHFLLSALARRWASRYLSISSPWVGPTYGTGIDIRSLWLLVRSLTLRPTQRAPC